MNDELFYVILVGVGPKGDEMYIEEMSRDVLLKRIDSGWYKSAKFFDKMPIGCDPRGWEENTVLVIKGKVVAPKPVEVVTKYDI